MSGPQFTQSQSTEFSGLRAVLESLLFDSQLRVYQLHAEAQCLADKASSADSSGTTLLAEHIVANHLLPQLCATPTGGETAQPRYT